jgi:hypothetical protein
MFSLAGWELLLKVKKEIDRKFTFLVIENLGLDLDLRVIN